jgi:anthranilate phosphoribosyltransferase
VLVNAAAGLVAAGMAPDLRSAMALAGQSIDSGAARRRLEQLQIKFPVS